MNKGLSNSTSGCMHSSADSNPDNALNHTLRTWVNMKLIFSGFSAHINMLQT